MQTSRASFVESYTGAFAEVVATRPDGAVVGLVQPLGQGRVLLFGAAVPANTLADLDLGGTDGPPAGLPGAFDAYPVGRCAPQPG